MNKDRDWNWCQAWDQVRIWIGVGVGTGLRIGTGIWIRVGVEIRVRVGSRVRIGKSIRMGMEQGLILPATFPQHRVLQPGARRAPRGHAAAAGCDGRRVPRWGRAAGGAGRVRPAQCHPLRHRCEAPPTEPHLCIPLNPGGGAPADPCPSLRSWGTTCVGSRIPRISSGRSSPSPVTPMRSISSMSQMRLPSMTLWMLWEIGSSAWKVPA